MLDKKLIGKYKVYLKENLSKKRYNHSVNVAGSALILARRYGCDEDRAYIAGLLHDCAKEFEISRQLELALQSDLDVCEIEKKAPPLYHAIAGSELVKTQFGITDKGIIHAIRYHTVACKDMPKLSQIVYLADLISEDRDYKDVKKMRKFAEQSLEKAMFEALRFSILDSAAKGNTIPVCTLEAYNDFALMTKNNT